MVEFAPHKRRAVSNVTALTTKKGTGHRGATVGPRLTEVSLQKGPARIFLIGMMRALSPTGENILPKAKKTQAVLAYLCLANNEPVLRSRIAGVIWDRSGEVQARDSLRHALRDLARFGAWRLETDHETVRLDTGGLWIDVFEAPDRPDLLLDNLYGITPGLDQWLMGERTRLEARWQALLEDELNALVAKNAAPNLRASAARRLLNLVPTHEPALRTLMRAFVDLDDRTQAIRAFERFRSLANTSLGLLPSDKTLALYDAIRLQSRAGAGRALLGPPSAASAAHATAQGPIAGEPAATEANSRPRASRPVEPSIAVLPFRSLSLDPGHDNVAEGFAEDLVEGLSRISGLFVVSRLSAAAFRGQDRPPREIADALGVRYLLSGSVRVIGEQARVLVELTDADTGLALWVSRYDEKFQDLIEIQSRLAEEIVRRVAPHVRSAEVKRVRVKRPESHDAYDLLLRAQESMNHPSREIFESAERLFELAIRHHPEYARALAWRAYWHVMRVGQGWSPDPALDTKQADHFAQRAIDCDRLEPLAFAVQGHVAAYLHKDFDLAFACFETAMRINPNSARASLWSASAHAWTGDGRRAIDRITRAMALSPYDPLVCAYSVSAAMAYFSDRQYGRAVEFALRCIGENRAYTSPYKLLIASLVLEGREQEARAPLHQLLLLEPGLTVKRFRRRFPGSAYPIADIFCDALAKGGAPLDD